MPTSHLHRPLRSRWLWAVLALIAAVFVALALEYPLALNAGRPPWTAHLMAAVVSNDFAFGPHSTLSYMTASYRQSLASLGSHMVLGALALGFGLVQLVPSWRRRWPMLHRVSGSIVILATLASMVGAIRFLLGLKGMQGSSGPVFHLGLWALAILTLFLLSQALLALWARDYRSHMVWMSLVFAALATAPALRMGWWLLGRWSGWDQETVNLACGTLVLLQTVVVMSAWLLFVGDGDLPARPVPTLGLRSHWLLLGLAGASAVVALHEGVLAPLRCDLLGKWRAASEHLPATAWLWALATAALWPQLPAAWQRAWRGESATLLTTLLGLALAAGSLLIGLTMPADNLAAHGVMVFWVGQGLLLALLVLGARILPLTRAGQDAATLAWLSWAWLPAVMPGWLLLALALGFTGSEAMAVALVNGIGGLMVVGVVVGFGARARLWATRGIHQALARPA